MVRPDPGPPRNRHPRCPAPLSHHHPSIHPWLSQPAELVRDLVSLKNSWLLVTRVWQKGEWKREKKSRQKGKAFHVPEMFAFHLVGNWMKKNIGAA